MTILDTTIVQFHNMSFKASKKKISTLLRHKTKEVMKAINAIQNIAKRHAIKRGKVFLAKTSETGKIGFAGIFAGVFCIFFSLIYTMICYANRRD